MIQEKLLNPAAPLFNKEDIVFIKPDNWVLGNTDWPYIGGPNEIDLKVLSSEAHPISLSKTSGKVWYYKLISGHGQYLEGVQEKYLVSPKDKCYYEPGEKLTLSEDTELAPQGTLFVKRGDWYSNSEKGIFIHADRMAKIKHLFS